MTLTPGTRLGSYEIQSAIGAGGMGEVYKAKDTRLDRSVAIKVLPAHVSADPDRRTRFAREAKTIAGLNHPHICTLHDVGEHDGTTYLVMELLTGETLAQRLEKGPLPLQQALTVATEIADALSAAHRQGVIHRDLKPGNVMLTKTGAKLLDFGLAKLRAPGAALGADFSSLPTRAAPETEKGTILGTLAYMAPEQLEGREADARSDLFSFGAVLYEMLTGTRAFTGASPASVISAVMSSQPPPISSLQPLTPPVLERLVRQCLAKAPDERPDTAHDVANDLRWLRETSGGVALTGVQPQRRRTVRTALTVAAGVVLLMVGAAVMWLLRPPAAGISLAHAALPVVPAEELNAGGSSSVYLPTPGGSRTALTWTPDGQMLVFVGRRAGVQQLYVRRLDAADAHPLAHTENAQVPAVSPDGQWVAFWADNAIRKVPLGGGLGVELARDVGAPRGLVWDAHGGLLAGTFTRGIWAIPAEGTPAFVTTVGDAEVSHSLPSLLPGGRVLLYTVRKRNFSWGDEEVVAQPLPTGDRKVLLTNAADARYVASGHLIFLRRGVLYAVPFDPERLQLRGREAPVVDGVAQALTAGSSADVTGAGQFAVAPTGTLAWIPGPVMPYEDRRLVTLDRRGQITPLSAPQRSYGPALRLSPDKRRAVVMVRTLTDSGLWLHDLGRPSPLLPLPMEGEAMWPVWASGGRELFFAWLTKGQWVLAVQPADGTAPPRGLQSGYGSPSSVAPDGRVAALAAEDIVVVTVESGKTRVEPLTRTPDTREQWPEFSPDGRWLAYGSDVTGRFEVYVRPYPGTGPAVPVSAEGGESPSWNPSGRELFFVTPLDTAGRRRMMAVEFAPESPPRFGRPKELFSFSQRDLQLACNPIRCYDVSADGQLFYALERATPPPVPPVTYINLIQNWFEELKAKVPTGR